MKIKFWYNAPSDSLSEYRARSVEFLIFASAFWRIWPHKRPVWLRQTQVTYSFHTTVVNNGLRAVHVYCRQIARLLCVWLSQWGHLDFGSISSKCRNKNRNWSAIFQLTVLCTLIKHALSTNQSAHYIETLFKKTYLNLSSFLGRLQRLWLLNLCFQDYNLDSVSVLTFCQNLSHYVFFFKILPIYIGMQLTNIIGLVLNAIYANCCLTLVTWSFLEV